MERYKILQKEGTLLLSALLLSCTPTPVATPATPAKIKATIESSKAPLTLVHVWATWCDPCRAEFPELMEVYNHFKAQGMELVLISVDEPADVEFVQAFLEEHNCPVGSLISTELSQKFIETLSPNWAGSLPSSFFYAKGALAAEWEGKRTYAQYAEQIEKLLNN